LEVQMNIRGREAANDEELIDIRDGNKAMRKVESGEMPTVAASEVSGYLPAPTPLAFWRRKRGYTQASLAQAMGLSQPYIGQIENGLRTSDVAKRVMPVMHHQLRRAWRVEWQDPTA
jgi:DNA-binding XRE family transcriptional regulator